jgi:hypothetical protein
MILLTDFSAFSTLCIKALEEFEAVGSCKGLMFNPLNCYQPTWAETRDESAQVEYSQNSTTWEDELSRHNDTADMSGLSSYVYPTELQLHRRNTSTAALPDHEIFRSRRTWFGPDSRYVSFCKLHRCTAFSQDTVDNDGIMRTDPSHCDAPVEMVHWDELVKDQVYVGKM